MPWTLRQGVSATRLGGLIAPFVLALAPATGVGWQPSHHCDVERVGGEFRFTRYRRESFVDARRRNVPLPTLKVWVDDRWNTTWAIRTNDARRTDLVVYGKVPPGYIQVDPLRTPPEPLRPGWVYHVECGDWLEFNARAFFVTETGVEILDHGDPLLSFGCSGCGSEQSLLMAFNDASAVFVGRVKHYEVAERSRAKPRPQRRATFEVSEWLKGGEGDEVVVMDGACEGTCDCPVIFQHGASYLVYAHQLERSRVLTARGCSRTKMLDKLGRHEARVIAEQLRPRGQ